MMKVPSDLFYGSFFFLNSTFVEIFYTFKSWTANATKNAEYNKFRYYSC